MENVPPLPVRKNQKTISIRETDYVLNKFLQEYNDGTITNLSGFRIYIDDFELLKNNFNIIEEINNKNVCLSITSLDYSILEYIENHLTNPGSFKLKLLDDYKNIDRSYIHPSNFKNTRFEMPLTYIQWCNNIKENILISSSNKKGNEDTNINAHFQIMDIEFLKYIRELTYKLSKKMDDLTEIDKYLIVVDYLQDIFQYVEGIESYASGCIYKIDPAGKDVDNLVYRPDTILKSHYGLCSGMSLAETLLFNNPFININSRSVRSMEHEYNVVKIGSNYYYDDNTWNVTRSSNKYNDALKSKSINTNYSLFGKDKALKMSCHIDITNTPEIEKEDFPREQIEDGLYNVKHIAKLSNYEKPVFKSKLKK